MFATLIGKTVCHRATIIEPSHFKLVKLQNAGCFRAAMLGLLQHCYLTFKFFQNSVTVLNCLKIRVILVESVYWPGISTDIYAMHDKDKKLSRLSWSQVGEGKKKSSRECHFLPLSTSSKFWILAIYQTNPAWLFLAVLW